MLNLALTVDGQMSPAGKSGTTQQDARLLKRVLHASLLGYRSDNSLDTKIELFWLHGHLLVFTGKQNVRHFSPLISCFFQVGSNYLQRFSGTLVYPLGIGRARPAGVGIVSLGGALFRAFFDKVMAVPSVIPVAHGKLFHVVSLYGYQGGSGS